MEELLNEIKKCQICKDHLPLGPNPVVQASAKASLLIIGQAPGTKVHESGIPWNDASGARLRRWLEIDNDDFYDPAKVAIMPMGFCYPGKGKSGDLPPRPECAPEWHNRILENLPNIQLILLIGQYAQKYYLAQTEFTASHPTLTAKVKHAMDCPAPFFPLPHPSPRNQIWLKKNPWFDSETIPLLRSRLNKRQF